MSDSLAQQTSAFDGLRWGQIRALVGVLHQCVLQTEWNIENRYKENASNFAQTLAFLTTIGLIKRSKGSLLLDAQLPEAHDTNFRWMVLERVLHSKSLYRTEIAHFLGKFELSDGLLSYQSSEHTRSKESAVRNFLMEVGAVTYSLVKARYAIAPEYISFCASVRQKSTHYSPKQVTAAAEDRDEIGLAAEEAVVAFEKERVGARLVHRVEHVALCNAAAGYDVLSVTAKTLEDAISRYIEVKAVSLRTFQFFWTLNEVHVAHLLGPLYYLYLLPVGVDGEIFTDRLVMICDPYSVVLSHADKWIVETSVLRC